MSSDSVELYGRGFWKVGLESSVILYLGRTSMNLMLGWYNENNVFLLDT